MRVLPGLARLLSKSSEAKHSFIRSGGGAQSDLLCQAICDCEAEPVVRNQTKELGILGVCYC